MESEYCRMDVAPKVGDERFVLDGTDLGFDLLSFWKWACSDLVGNTARGILAEYIVAKALGIECRARVEWDAFDLVTRDGRTIEVKSASYLQTWEQKQLSKIIFGIQPTKGWYASTNTSSVEYRRQADLYVFCLLGEQNQANLNPLNVGQWEFYVVPTATLDRECPLQKTIGLTRLKAIAGEPVAYQDLAWKVAALNITPRNSGVSTDALG